MNKASWLHIIVTCKRYLKQWLGRALPHCHWFKYLMYSTMYSLKDEVHLSFLQRISSVLLTEHTNTVVLKEQSLDLCLFIHCHSYTTHLVLVIQSLKYFSILVYVLYIHWRCLHYIIFQCI